MYIDRCDDKSLLVPCENDLEIAQVRLKFLDKTLRTWEYSEILKASLIFGYEKLEIIDKTQPHQFWAHGRAARVEASQTSVTSSPHTTPS